MNPTSKHELKCLGRLGTGLGSLCDIKYMESSHSAQGNSTVMKRAPDPAQNDHVLIHAPSDPRSHTSYETATDHLAETYSLHFLTNCQWDVNVKAKVCSKPWDFGKYMLWSEFFEDDSLEDDPLRIGYSPRSYQSLLKRNYVKSKESEPEEYGLKEKWEKNINNRRAFSKVHLTGCVLLGLSLLCTAISFFILPTLGQWISVVNLVLATLATIFLLTSSIFTAVLAKKVAHEFGKDEYLSEFHAIQPGKTLRALV